MRFERRTEASADGRASSDPTVTRESDEGLNGGKSEALVSLGGAMRQSDEAPTAGYGSERSGGASGDFPVAS